jgi:hypothetical protein
VLEENDSIAGGFDTFDWVLTKVETHMARESQIDDLTE